MTIRSMKHYHNSHWDWGMFKGCFDNPRVTLMDLDGMVERNGYMLLIETKWPGGDLSGGQRIAFTNLCKTNFTSVIVVWGQPQQPEEMQIYHLGHVYDRQPCDKFTLRLAVKRWYDWASSQPPAWMLTDQLKAPQTAPGHRSAVR